MGNKRKSISYLKSINNSIFLELQKKFSSIHLPCWQISQICFTDTVLPKRAISLHICAESTLKLGEITIDMLANDG
jgi:hypothetical protein